MKNGVPWRERRRLAQLEAKKSAPPRKVTPKPTTKRQPATHNPHKPRGIVPWEMPDTWNGKVFHIVGGGPSLKDQANIERMKAVRDANPDDAWIAVNNSYKIAPWCDILHFADCEWWRWNGDDVMKRWKAEITTATSDVTHVNHPRIRRFWRDRNDFTRDRMKLHGWDSGTQAVNLAFHLGASKIVLWGIDMQAAADGSTQWHNEHKRETYVPNYQKKFAPSLAEAVRQLNTLGIRVIRATEPGIPEAPFEPAECGVDTRPEGT